LENRAGCNHEIFLEQVTGQMIDPAAKIGNSKFKTRHQLQKIGLSGKRISWSPRVISMRQVVGRPDNSTIRFGQS